MCQFDNLNMQMCGEPEFWFQSFKNFHSRSRTKLVRLNVLLEKLLLTKELTNVAVVVDATRPIVAQNDIYKAIKI